MAPTTKNSKKSFGNILKSLHNDYINVNYGKSLLFDPAKLPIVSIGIIFIELILNVFIVQRIKYTEIDWTAYMQQCEGFLNGTTNYSQLKGMQNITSSSLRIFFFLIIHCIFSIE